MAPDPNLWEKYVSDQFAITSSGSRIFEPLTHIFQQTDSFLPIDQLIVLKHRFIHKHAFLMVFSFRESLLHFLPVLLQKFQKQLPSYVL